VAQLVIKRLILHGQTRAHNLTCPYSSVPLKFNGAVTLNKKLCYCRGTARRATSVEILWPFFDWAIDKKLCWCRGTVRAHCQLKSCKMLHKCSTYYIWKRLQVVMTFKVIQGHCRCCHLIGHFLLVFHCKCMPILHRFRDINTYFPKI